MAAAEWIRRRLSNVVVYVIVRSVVVHLDRREITLVVETGRVLPNDHLPARVMDADAIVF